MSTPTIASPFTTVTTTDLASVTGGASSRATTDDRLMSKLERITVAVKDAADRQAAAKAQNPMAELMPIMAMGMMRKRQG